MSAVTAQLSVAVASNSVPTVVYEHTPGLVDRLVVPGQVMIGAWLSLTVTVKVQLVVPPDGSVTIYFTLESPLLNTPFAEPDPLRVVAPVTW